MTLPTYHGSTWHGSAYHGSTITAMLPGYFPMFPGYHPLPWLHHHGATHVGSMCQVFAMSDAVALRDDARKQMLRVQLELLSRSMDLPDTPTHSPDPSLPARRDRPNLD